MARVRYIVDDVEAVAQFYVSNFGFEIELDAAPAISILALGDLTLLVSGPRASASQPMLDGTVPSPGGGWNRIVLDFEDLESVVENSRGMASISGTIFWTASEANRLSVKTLAAT